MAKNSTVAAIACPSYDLVLVRHAIENALLPFGGISSFVRPGETVLIKPNLLSPRLPEEAVTSHPSVVAAVVRICVGAGCRVWVGDSPAGNHAERDLWTKTGMLEAVQSAGGTLKSFQGAVMPLTCGASQIPVPAWLPEVDKIISIPKLKTHLLTGVTCALKNTYGFVAGGAKALYHASHPSPAAMSSFLVDIFSAVRPTLSIVDAVEIMEGRGPASGRRAHLGLILASDDAVALDSVAARVFGLAPEQAPMIRIAAERNLGIAQMERITVVGTGQEILARRRFRRSFARILGLLPEPFFRSASLAVNVRPKVYHHHCVSCGICETVCSQRAITKDIQGRLVIDYDTCIACMCCMESCKQGAIRTLTRFDLLRRSAVALGRQLSRR
jgi:uncharacterized protein (DUF362 family)/Pyruvate/2-oxoacid:ferredoxin oxidoreductase delta subunit